MSPQLIQIAECLNEANTREIKIARCLAESLKRIQELEQSKTEASQQAKEAEKRFSAALHDLAEQLTKTGEETTSIAQHLSKQINTEKEQFSAELSNVVDQLTKTSEQAKVEFSYKVDEIALKLAELPAQMAAFKAEFATPSVQADAPKSFNPRGAYESGEKYQPFDYVSANGSSYIALVENPTEPPSKKSKQWMLVAARGASGSGGIISASEVVGLGTAAYRDVGLSLTNVLTVDDAGLFSLSTTDGLFTSTVFTWDGTNNRYDSGEGDLLYIEGGTWLLTSAAGEIYRSVLNAVSVTNPSANTQWVTQLDHPDGEGLPADLTFVRDDYAVARVGDFDGYALTSQVGDRYLTSSTTSLLIGNGAKTLTVGTGLAYSPTQDVTIAYDGSNHMHASVTSYNSATGVLVVDVQQHTGSGTYAVWTVNVGGIDAGAIPSGGTTGQVLAKLSSTNYDDAWVTPTVAVGGITGLGTGVATALAINVGTAGAAVVLNGAGGTPSSITLTNATGYPAATTTTAGTVPGIGINAINAPTATNAATLAQINGLSRRTMSMLFTDFMGRTGSIYSTEGFQWGTQSASGGLQADQASEASHPGINRLSTGATSASGYFGFDTASTNNAIYLLNDGTLYWEWCIRIPTLSDATNRFIVHVGCAPANASVSSEMFSIRYSDNVNSGKFLGVCRTASSETTVDTGITVVANTWYRVGALMNANATSAQFYIDGVATGAAITTNIPTNTSRLGGGIYKTVGAAAARTMDVDYTYYLKTFTSAR
jgi:hypothetical protein